MEVASTAEVVEKLSRRARRPDQAAIARRSLPEFEHRRDIRLRTAGHLPLQAWLCGAKESPQLIDHDADENPGTDMPTATARYTPASATPSLDDLLQAVGEQNPTAWEEILRRYGNLVRARVRTFRLQEADALDAVQMTWLRLAENWHQVQFPERLAGWLSTTARRECMHILRQPKYTVDLTEPAKDVADPSVDIEQHVIDAETAQMLRDLVAELPPRRRTLLRALFSEDPEPYTEVARIAGIPPGSIGPTRGRALRQLRWMAHQRGLGVGA
ncbi:MAG: RNA polymerase sigma factor [Pseudonocardiaceae bacterium]